ncbi:hypothetical protein [Spirosoma knui]
MHRATTATILLQSARQDEAIAVAEALHQAAPRGTIVKWHDTGHRLNTQSYLDQLTWFHQQLGTQAIGTSDQQGPNFPGPIPSKKP